MECDNTTPMAHVYLTEAELQFLADHIGELCAGQLLGEVQAGIDLSSLSVKFSDAFLQSRERHCAHCGIVLTSPNPRKTTCGEACRQAHSRGNRARRAAINASLR